MLGWIEVELVLTITTTAGAGAWLSMAILSYFHFYLKSCRKLADMLLNSVYYWSQYFTEFSRKRARITKVRQEYEYLSQR